MAGMQYLHPAEAASAAYRISAGLLSQASTIWHTPHITLHDMPGTVTAATLVSLASHQQPEVRQACYRCIASQALQASSRLESAATCQTEGGASAAHAEAAGLVRLLLQPDIWTCIMDSGLSDPCCEGDAAEIVHCCARAVSASSTKMRGSARSLQPVFGQAPSPGACLSLAASASSAASADGHSGSQQAGLVEVMAQDTGPDALLSHPLGSASAASVECPLAQCGMRLVESIPKLTCYPHLGSKIADAFALIRGWQQQQMCSPASSSSSSIVRLKQLDLVHHLQQLFHVSAPVRTAAVVHVHTFLGKMGMPCNAAAAWNGSFDSLKDALAVSGPQCKPATPSLAGTIRWGKAASQRACHLLSVADEDFSKIMAVMCERVLYCH